MEGVGIAVSMIKLNLYDTGQECVSVLDGSFFPPEMDEYLCGGQQAGQALRDHSRSSIKFY